MFDTDSHVLTAWSHSSTFSSYLCWTEATDLLLSFSLRGSKHFFFLLLLFEEKKNATLQFFFVLLLAVFCLVAAQMIHGYSHTSPWMIYLSSLMLLECGFLFEWTFHDSPKDVILCIFSYASFQCLSPPHEQRGTVSNVSLESELANINNWLPADVLQSLLKEIAFLFFSPNEWHDKIKLRSVCIVVSLA